jgi:hypothetical protein
LNEGAHVGVLDIIFKTFKMNVDGSNDTAKSKDLMKKVLKQMITSEFSVKAISHAVVLQLCLKDLALMLKEFESIFEVLMKEEFEILRPMLKLRL